MKLLKTMLPFWIVFSLAFFLLRIKDPFYGSLLMADIGDLGGITYLYATVGIIFSILAGFIIGNRWDRWNNLAVAVTGEVTALEELWLWSQHLSAGVTDAIHRAIREYLSLTIRRGWDPRATCDASADEDRALVSLRTGILDALQRPDLTFTISSIFSNFLRHRSGRLRTQPDDAEPQRQWNRLCDHAASRPR
ncbi:MAG: hypothetical protein FJ246_05855 [Nitrospira sp.]|nr:hypothetical protein [Nitrospira sp.]